MLMPETAVHKDYSFIFGENYIRTSRQLLHILTITESFCKRYFRTISSGFEFVLRM